MFRIIPPGLRDRHRTLLDDMHAMRYRVVVEEWGWTVPGIEAGYDRDQFDTPDTVYVIVEDAGGHVAASARLNPTTSPHMMSELFAAWCDLQPWPVAPDVWECSRFVLDRSRAESRLDMIQLRARLGIGITAWCLDHGVRRLSWLTHQAFYNHVSGLFRTEPLGLPRRQGDDWAWIAAVSQIDLPALDRQLDRHRNAGSLAAALDGRERGAQAGEAA